MVEKFDNYRIRFKRRTDQRKNDQFLDFDPYRTHVGMASGPVAAIIVGSVLLALLIIFGVVMAVKTGLTPQGSMVMIIGGAILIIGIVFAIVTRSSGKR